MNVNQVFVAGVVLVALGALPVVLSVQSYAVDSLHDHDGRAISGADQFEKAIQHSEIRLTAGPKSRPTQPRGGSLGTGSVGGSATTEGTSKVVKPQAPYGQCYSLCMARCQVTPVPVPTTNCASKCSQQCRPQAN